MTKKRRNNGRCVAERRLDRSCALCRGEFVADRLCSCPCPFPSQRQARPRPRECGARGSGAWLVHHAWQRRAQHSSLAQSSTRHALNSLSSAACALWRGVSSSLEPTGQLCMAAAGPACTATAGSRSSVARNGLAPAGQARALRGVRCLGAQGQGHQALHCAQHRGCLRHP